MEVIDIVLKKFGEAFSWLKSKIEAFLKFTSKQITDLFNRATRFYDNFTEEFKEALVKSQSLISESMKKVSQIMKLLWILFCSSLQQVKKNLTCIKNLMVSLVKELQKKLLTYLKSFMGLMKEAGFKTAQRFKSSKCFNSERFSGLYNLILGLVQLIKIIQEKPLRLPYIFSEANLFYCKKGNRTMKEMKYGDCFENLAKDERKLALFIYVFLKIYPPKKNSEREKERESMEASQVDLKVVDRVLELLTEAISWVKTLVEAFFKQLWNEPTKALFSVKTLVINCCEKLKQVLAETNALIDVGVQETQLEGSLLDELMKLLPKMVTFVGFVTKSADPEWRSKGENLKGHLDLVEGFIELLQLSSKNQIFLIPIFVDGFMIYRQNVNNQVGNNAWKFPKHEGKAAFAIAALLSFITKLK